jgi:uncharacterized protein HemX
MISNLIYLVIMLAIGFIIWQVHKIRMAQAGRASEEKKKQESLVAQERKELKNEENIIEEKDERKLRLEIEELDRKTKIERDIKEMELRRKIQDRKDREAQEKKGE